MTNFKLASQILRGLWLIEPNQAVASGLFVSKLINGEEIKDGLNQRIQASLFPSEPKITGDENQKTAAIIPIKGVLLKEDEFCSYGTATIGNWIKEADNNNDIDVIFLHIDSPGGSVDGTETLANIIKDTQKPTVAFLDGFAASAAVWIYSSANLVIAASETTQIGSVGVMSSFADLRPVWEKLGIKFYDVTADTSKDKNKAFFDAMKGDFNALKAESLNPIDKVFMDTMKETRGLTDEQLTGKMYIAKNVIGTFIDAIGNFEYAMDEAFKLAENNNTNNNNTNAMSNTNKDNFAIKDEKSLKKWFKSTFGIATKEEQEAAEKAEQTKKDLFNKDNEIAQLIIKNKEAKTENESLKAENEALQTRLSKTKAAKSVKVKDETKANADDVDWDLINSFEHNKEADLT